MQHSRRSESSLPLTVQRPYPGESSPPLTVQCPRHGDPASGVSPSSPTTSIYLDPLCTELPPHPWPKEGETWDEVVAEAEKHCAALFGSDYVRFCNPGTTPLMSLDNLPCIPISCDSLS
ncbi:hypothetical protein AAHA92_06159 [Salvia divinorum]|uniref:Uncharacterized protein n=1 Tax=Salvia divinorum TaxID=28513 RepID=A0ABD1I737_SALDI